MRYVDGYVLPVPKKNLNAYLRMAAWGRKCGGSTARSITKNALATTSKRSGNTVPAHDELKPGRPWFSRISSSSRGRIAIASTPR